MKAEVGGCQCRKQSLIEDAHKEKEVLPVPDCPEINNRDLVEDNSTTLNLMFTATSPSTTSLNSILKILEKYEANVFHMETRPALKYNKKEDLECYLKCFIPNSFVNILIYSLKKVAGDVKIVKDDLPPSFPKKVQDLDMYRQHLIMKFEPNFDQNHPGYGDQEYKKRRTYFAELAFTYRDGDALPRVEYTAEETATWKQVYKSLSTLYPNYACKQYLDAFQQLEKYCGFTENSIPQLQDVSNFLKERTGFKLRPAAGLLPARDFLACLAFRVFPTTQYLRHPSTVMHSPEPDCCHELLGHIPMLADKEFAQFSQDIGLASLGASDEDIEKLSTLYWFTIEFGLCKQDDSIRAYGAGLLSSYGELKYALSNKPELRPFDPEITAVQPYEDNCFQPVYFVSESFDDSKAKLRQYALKMKKPFSLCYDPLTCSVEVLDSIQKVQTSLSQIIDELNSLCSALNKMCKT
ncbi:PREDICTED: tyrosine 3-monooxygenase-like [Nanorana parkeri]|uniref:tyrosine 3-monooxygenase-like n=1 Tax=Nanorana parkeri TaxID=125878 RepID=UPI0008545AFE|nr:PREDICTED: tyrosine 3-monooxygenase-like [Nanorana parkeri]